MNSNRIQEIIRDLIVAIGDDPEREGLRETPARVAHSMAFLFRGYEVEGTDIARKAIFSQHTNHMVMVRDIDLYSMCEHHLLPFFGRCHIAYIAEGKVIGISKLARIVDCYARRLQLQERLTEQIAHAVMDGIGAQGVGVVAECQHLCMMMRGVEKQNSSVITSSLLGTFHDCEPTRLEFLSLVGRG